MADLRRELRRENTGTEDLDREHHKLSQEEQRLERVLRTVRAEVQYLLTSSPNVPSLPLPSSGSSGANDVLPRLHQIHLRMARIRELRRQTLSSDDLNREHHQLSQEQQGIESHRTTVRTENPDPQKPVKDLTSENTA
ncbi:hypothetical protein BGX23_011850 [Mortierella sp. AD031]|nr:hypothetical protein BGX23_011850 [Mortierella sp. AD031]